MLESRIRILLLHAQYTTRLSFYDDWLDAFCAYPGFETIPIDIVPLGAGKRIRKALSDIDAIILSHSTNCDTLVYLKRHLDILTERRVPLLTFVGNEVNLPGSPIEEKRQAFAVIRPEWIATQLLMEAGQYLFGDLPTKGMAAIPHALSPKVFSPSLPASHRPIDIGARSVRYLPHLGDNDRNRIFDRFSALNGRDFVVDISNARFDRAGWALFLNRCKGTVGTEAGSWFLERDDRTVNAIRDYVRKRSSSGVVIANNSRLRTFGHRLPWWARTTIRHILKRGPLRIEAGESEAIDFAEIYDLFFKNHVRPPVYGKCISSRHFEAAGTKTCQIMLRGRFNDLLEADRHYIALASDFRNLENVLARFADPAERDAIANACYEHVRSTHTFANRMKQTHDLLSASATSAAPTSDARCML